MGTDSVRRHGRRHGRRYRQITDILVRHGLGYFVGVLGLERFVPFQRGWFGHARRAEPYTRPEHVRLAIEELGTTFIKLGQILSTRADLLPPEYAVELARLQDEAPAVPSDAIREILAAEFERPIDELFATFEWAPLAAGSIGQAHAATLLDGTEVVVKVRRPGVVEQVAEDLEILSELARTAVRRWPPAAQYDIIGLVQEFSTTLLAELDYPHEAYNAERIGRAFAGDTTIHIPRVFGDLSTSRVLTAEHIHGIKISNLAALDAAGIDRPELARNAVDAILKMVFEDGFFHADPHPGNFFIEPDGRIGLIDFGMVGTLDDQTRDHLIDVLVAVTNGDTGRLVDAFLQLGFARARVDRVMLRRDLQMLTAHYVDRSLDEIDLRALLGEVLAVIRRHHMQLPPNLALLLKMGVMAEGLGAQLDPRFRLVTVLQPYGERMLRRRYAPLVLGRQFAQAGIDLAQFGAQLPSQARRILNQLERGELEVSTRPTDIEPILRRLERLVNRIVLGMIAAAFIVSLAVLMTIYHPPGWDRWAGWLFVVGFAVALGLGIYLAWSILRSGHR